MAECVFSDGCDTVGDRKRGQPGAIIERPVPDRSDARCQVEGCNGTPVVIPWDIIRVRVVGHRTGSGDGEHAVIRQHPGQIVTLRAAGNNRSFNSGRQANVPGDGSGNIKFTVIQE